MISELKVNTVKLFMNNNLIMKLIKNSEFHARTKHIEIRHHFIKNVIESERIRLLKINENDNSTDLFIKPLFKSTFEKHMKILKNEEIVE